tara:strand:- start:298 stop:1032 length:735 start_codon:yes stop_codon:yes gene_type:complete
MKIESPKNDLQPFLKLFDRFKPLKKLIKKNPLILDIGANIGDSIFEFNKILKPKKIYAFEPQKHCVKILHKRFSKNKRIKIYDYAIDTKSGSNIFYEQGPGDVHAGFYKVNIKSKDHIDLKNKKIKNKNYINQINNKVLVKTISLDQFINKENIKRINLLKIDTEGHEEKVLKSLKKNINKVDIILLEMTFWDYYEKTVNFFSIEKIIRNHFSLYDISYIAKNPKNFRTDYIDVIYVNKLLDIK